MTAIEPADLWLFVAIVAIFAIAILLSADGGKS